MWRIVKSLAKYQSGFQTNDFTVNQLVEIYNTIILNIDKGIKDIRFVFCDITKAFDRVWHNGLLFKLKHYGVAGNILSWIEHYLTDRKQKVVVKGFSSSFKSINAGVPQGSVLGPFLFLLYINDISNGLANSIRLFADDTTLYATVECDIKNVTSSLNDDLEKIIVWSNKWAIDFNPFKTVNVDFSRKKLQLPELQFGIKGPKISQSLSHTHLGIHFQSDGHWNKHIHTIHDKAAKRLNLLRMLKYKINL